MPTSHPEERRARPDGPIVLRRKRLRDQPVVAIVLVATLVVGAGALLWLHLPDAWEKVGRRAFGALTEEELYALVVAVLLVAAAIALPFAPRWRDRLTVDADGIRFTRHRERDGSVAPRPVEEWFIPWAEAEAVRLRWRGRARTDAGVAIRHPDEERFLHAGHWISDDPRLAAAEPRSARLLRQLTPGELVRGTHLVQALAHAGIDVDEDAPGAGRGRVLIVVALLAAIALGLLAYLAADAAGAPAASAGSASDAGSR